MAEIEIDPELLPEQHELAPVRSRLESPAGGTGLDRLPPPFFPSRARKGTRGVVAQTVAKPALEATGADAGEDDAANVPEDAFIAPDAPIRRESRVSVDEEKRSEVRATGVGDDAYVESVRPSTSASGDLSSPQPPWNADGARRLADRLEDLAGRLRAMGADALEGASALQEGSDHDAVDVALRSLLARFLTVPGRDVS